VSGGRGHGRKALVLGLVLLSAAACRQILGVESRKRGDSPLALGEMCGACVDDTCESAERTCAADEACRALAQCVAAHPADPAARVECEAASPLAAQLTSYASLNECMRGACQDDCMSLVGLFANFASACDPCVVADCAGVVRSCIAQPSCERTVVAAFEQPTELTPPDLITVNNAVGVEGEPLRALYRCLLQDSPCAECGFDGRDLQCTGNYKWPTPSATTARVEFDVTISANGSDFEPFNGALFTACAALAPPCEALDGGTGITDADGFVAVNVPTAIAGGFKGYFTLTGESRLGDIRPVKGYTGRPIYDGMRGAFSVLTTDVLPPPAEGRAHVVIGFFDCRGWSAPGVTLGFPDELFGADPSAILAYDDAGDRTGPLGLAFVLNAVPGCFEVAGAIDGVEPYRVAFEAAAGETTYVFAFPRSDSAYNGDGCEPAGVAP